MNARRLILSLCATVCGVLVCAGVPSLAAAAQALQVEEEFVTNVASSSATLHAVLNPGGVDTTYRFEDATMGGEFTLVGEAGAPAPEGASGDAGESATGMPLEVHVQGLSPDTLYRFRLVAVSSVEAVDGGEREFTTQGVGGALELPDGRAWELVSPPTRDGALIHGLESEFLVGAGADDQAAADGSAVTYMASTPTEAEPQGYVASVSVLSTRGASGWSSRVISPPHDRGTGPATRDGGEFHLFSEDLSHAVLQPYGPFKALSPEASEPTAYLRTDYLAGNVGDLCSSSCYRPLVTAANTQPGVVFSGEFGSSEACEVFCGPVVMAATPDLSHMILVSYAQLTPTSGETLYEWSAGQLRPIGVLPQGEEPPEPGQIYLPGNPTFQEELGARGAKNVVSADGERVVFLRRLTNGEGGPGSGALVGPLYLRENAMQPQSPIGPKGECTVLSDACTVRLDGPQGEGATGSVWAQYITASRDTSRVFFTDEGRLTSGSSASGRDLYEYDLNAPPGRRLTDLSADANVGESANVGSVLGVSEDGSYVYFLAGGALAPGATPNSSCTSSVFGTDLEDEADETCNLYVRHNGVTTLIAPGISGGYEIEERARVSPDGHLLAFMSEKGLTGYDTRDVITGEPDEEVYLYDAQTNKLVCASCNPTGARPAGGEHAEHFPFPVASNEPIWTRASGELEAYIARKLYQSRYLFNDGRLFFESNDALVAQDVNGARDVYEFEPAGLGSCTSTQATFNTRSGGCVDLISSGTSPRQGVSTSDLETSFVDASETGGDVFFLSAGQLLAQDLEPGLSLYDAHECTALSPCGGGQVAQSPPCDTEASCRPAPAPQPAVFGAPASATLAGTVSQTAPAPAPAVVKPRALTRAQRLARALRACRGRSRKARVACERRARARYRRVRPRVAAAKKGKR